MPASLKEAPWLSLDPGLLAQADPVVTMLHQDERQMYYWLARDYAQDRGAIVDLGAYVGGSTACLAAGAAAGQKTARVFAFDRFEIKNADRKAQLLKDGVPDFDGSDILPAIQTMLSPWSDRIDLRPGDIRHKGWFEGAIELLIVDAAKHADTADHIAATYYKNLIPGQSLVVHQDFLNARQPWIAAQMALLQDYFEPLALCHRESIVFLNTKPIPEDVLANAEVAPLSNGAYIKAIRDMQGILEPLDVSQPMRRVLKTAKAYPDIRAAYRLAGAIRAKRP